MNSNSSNPQTCILYARTSTRAQRNALTIEAQVDVCNALVVEHGLTPLAYGAQGDGWVLDPGYSGTLVDGRHFSQLLNDLRSKKIRPTYIVVAELSRLCRIDKYSEDNQAKLDESHAAAAKISATLIGAGVSILDSDGPCLPSGVEFQMKAVGDNVEVVKIRRRTMNGKAKRLKGGSASSGSCPFGYRTAPIDPLNRAKGLKWERHPVQGDQLVQLLAWYIEGGSTFAAKQATDAGFELPSKHWVKKEMTAEEREKTKPRKKTKNPGAWGVSTVESIVKHRIGLYLGETTFKLDAVSYPIKYDALIDKATYAAVVQRTKAKAIGERVSFLGSGHLRCKCGLPLNTRFSGYVNGENGRKHPLHYARCLAGCGSVRERTLSAALWDATVSRMHQITRAEKTVEESDVGAVARIGEAKSKIAQVQAKLLILSELALDGMPRETWKIQNDKLSQDLVLARAELDRIVAERDKRAQRQASEQTVADRLDALLVELDIERGNLTLDRKRTVLADLLAGERVEVTFGKRTGPGLSPYADIELPVWRRLPPMVRRAVPGKEYIRQHAEL